MVHVALTTSDPDGGSYPAILPVVGTPKIGLLIVALQLGRCRATT